MNQEDRDRLVRIETILTESVAPRLSNHSDKLEKLDTRMKAVERVAVIASVMWGGICVVAYAAKDSVAQWIAHKVVR